MPLSTYNAVRDLPKAPVSAAESPAANIRRMGFDVRRDRRQQRTNRHDARQRAAPPRPERGHAREGADACAVRARPRNARPTIEILDRFLEHGTKHPISERFAHFAGIVKSQPIELDTTHPYILGNPQNITDRLLAEHAAELDAETRTGCDVVGVSPYADGVTATLANGTELRAHYLVGDDGGHSTVRKGRRRWLPRRTQSGRHPARRDEPRNAAGGGDAPDAGDPQTESTASALCPWATAPTASSYQPPVSPKTAQQPS